jgi:hypothetical protein
MDSSNGSYRETFVLLYSILPVKQTHRGFKCSPGLAEPEVIGKTSPTKCLMQYWR